MPATRPGPLRLALWIGTIASLMPAPPTPAQDRPPAPVATQMGQPVTEYARRRRALMDQIKQADAANATLRAAMQAADGGSGPTPATIVVLVGRGATEAEGRLHQDENFAYLSGIDGENAALILWPETGDEALYLPPRDPGQERWTGPRLAPGPDAPARTGFARVESSANFVSDLFRALADPRTGARARAGTVHMLAANARTDLSNPASRFSQFVHEGAPAARQVNIYPRLSELRVVKSAPEQALIRRAIAATADAHAEVARVLAPGITETKLEGVIFAGFLAGGGSRAAFPSIVGSGPNSTVLHYGRNDRTVADGDLVVVDIGAEAEGYAADITRTYPASGRFTPRQREIYQLVLDAQTGVAAQFKVGVTTLPDQNRWVRDFFRASPLRARDADGTEHTMEHFFIHGLGHHLGLEVHDVGDTSKPLAPGSVFTIEPGLYLPSEGFGVRIEDDYLVTATGLEKLSGSIPSDPAAVEARMSAARTPSPTP